MANLSKQVSVYSLPTDCFLNKEELAVKKKKDKFYDMKRLQKNEGEINSHIIKLKEEVLSIDDDEKKDRINKKISKLERQIGYLKWLENYFDGEDFSKTKLKDKLKELIDKNKDCIRELNENYLHPKSVISLFESTLTRKLELETDKLSDKLIIVEVYDYGVFENLLNKGFRYQNKKYIYFSSSSGQIRNKKAIFIDEEEWIEVDKALMCGLSVGDINKKGGMSVNKFLSYKALTNSASEPWIDFPIDKTIVVDDVKVVLKDRIVDYVDRESYEVIREKRPITLEITDGAGMILPDVSEKVTGSKYKNFQFRAPFMKGLLSPCNFKEFNEGESLIVKDCFGKTHDIIEEEIEIIFFKSQFKMKKYFDSWTQYQQNFKNFNCEASFMNVEEDNIPDAKTNYQYLQSLIDLKNEEFDELVKSTNAEIVNLGSDLNTMLRVLGADDNNEHKNYFQQALSLYNPLINDDHAKEAIKNRKKSLVKEAKGGKLKINGKFTYVLPDWYAVMQKIFLNEQPVGLLRDGQVSCKLYAEVEVDLLRSPSLSLEHIIRENRKSKEMKKWFTTKGVYISAADHLPKVLQADFDGDRLLITSCKILIAAAKRNIKVLDVVPLEYKMGVAPAKQINPETIYESLTTAFKADIGTISNNISKIYNSEIDYKTIKQLCAYNNYVIDMAKTLDLPIPPSEVKVKWNQYINQKVPYFFQFAKNKEKDQTEIRNNSTVNRLVDKIKSPRITFRSVAGKFDFRNLMKKTYIGNDKPIVNEETDNLIISVYTKFDQNKVKYMNASENDERSAKKKIKYVYKLIRKELLKIHSHSYDVADVLTRHLYKEKSPFKSTLWEVFGRELVSNIKRNVYNIIECKDCTTEVKKETQRQERCEVCQKEYRKRRDRERKSKNKISA